jgi:AraC family transcriptional regulator
MAMRPTQHQRYAEQIDRVVQYLQRLDWSRDEQGTDLESLASIANLSSWHFHRIFRLMTGESVGDLVRRIRVARGIAMLDHSSAQVTNAAMASGYSTPQAFARATREVTGRSPTDLRRAEDVLASLRARLNAKDNRNARPPLLIEITSIDPFTVQALRNVGDYKHLDAAYGRLFEMVFAEQSIESLRGIYGVPHDDPLSVPAHMCQFDCAVQLDPAGAVTPPVKTMRLGGGTYVIGRHIGDYNLIHATIDQFVCAVLECDGITVADAPLHIRYHDQPEERPIEELRADFFIPLEWV